MQLHYKDIEIHFAEYGTASKTIVLLHGFLENQTMWDYFVQEYSKTYRVITIDLLGHGQTPCLGYVHTMEDQADAPVLRGQDPVRRGDGAPGDGVALDVADHALGGEVAIGYIRKRTKMDVGNMRKPEHCFLLGHVSAAFHPSRHAR